MSPKKVRKRRSSSKFYSSWIPVKIRCRKCYGYFTNLDQHFNHSQVCWDHYAATDRHYQNIFQRHVSNLQSSHLKRSPSDSIDETEHFHSLSASHVSDENSHAISEVTSPYQEDLVNDYEDNPFPDADYDYDQDALPDADNDMSFQSHSSFGSNANKSSHSSMYPIMDVSQLLHEKRYVYNKADLAYVRILDFLDRVGAPLYSFDLLMKILGEIAADQLIDFASYHPSRQSLLRRMEQIFGPFTAPVQVQVPLETDATLNGSYVRRPRDIAHVIVFDCKQQIKSLLGDMGIMSDLSNLAVDPHNPFGRYRTLHGRLGELNSGEWYDRTYAELQVQYKDYIGPPLFLLPVKLYVDKTGTDMCQRHGLEPVMLTLNIFKERIQNQCYRCHRLLGYVPDLDQKSQAQKRQGKKPGSSGRACRNYHACLKPILSGLENLMRDGFKYYLTLGNQARLVRIIVRLSVIYGDGKSGDTLCTRTPHYQQPRTCRGCYTPFLELSVPRPNPCEWVLQEEQRELLHGCEEPGKENDADLRAALKSVSTIRCDSILFNLNYGSNPFGQYSACTVDLMHAFEAGLVKHILTVVIGDMSTLRQGQADDFFDILFGSHRCSFTDSYPRTHFKKGVTGLTHLAAHEWVGLLLVFLVTAQTYKGREIMQSRFDDNDKQFKLKVQRWKKEEANRQSSFGRGRQVAAARSDVSVSSSDGNSECSKEICSKEVDDVSNDEEGKEEDEDDDDDYESFPRCTVHAFVALLEQLLSFHAYYKQELFWRKDDPSGPTHFHEAMMDMLEQLKSTLRRSNGSGWNLQKVHEVFFHIGRQITEYGAPSNTDCNVGERGLKTWGKHDSKRTKKGDVGTFTKNTAERMYENSVFSRAQQAMDFESTKMSLDGVRKGMLDPQPKCNAPDGMMGNHKYTLSLLPSYDTEGRKHYYLDCQWHTTSTCHVELHDIIVRQFLDEYYDLEENASSSQRQRIRHQKILGYTQYCKNGKVYRCHPNYMDKGPWYDFVVIPWQGYTPYHLQQQRQRRRRGNQVKARATDPSTMKSYLDEVYNKKKGQHRTFVPARLMALYRHPQSKVEMALVHSCQPQMMKNQERNSVLTESWHLYADKTNIHVSDEKGNQTVATKYIPMFHIIEAEQIIDGVRVYIEDPRIQEYWPIHDSSGHCVLLTSRSKHWAKQFLEHRYDDEEYNDDNSDDE